MHRALLFALLLGCDPTAPQILDDGGALDSYDPLPPRMFECVRDASACGGAPGVPAGNICGYGDALIQHMAIVRCLEQYPEQCCRVTCERTAATCAQAEHPCARVEKYCGPIPNWEP